MASIRLCASLFLCWFCINTCFCARHQADNGLLVSSVEHATQPSYILTADGPFGHISWDIFKSTVLMKEQDCSATKRSMPVALHLQQDVLSKAPKHFDWRNQGVVSAVKNQGHCGSCWTFSTTGALEAHHAIKHGMWRTPTLSEQQLVDCAGDFDNAGCNGGLPSHAFEYIHQAGGLSQEFFYPYQGVDAACRWNRSEVSKLGATTIRSFNITEGDEDEIMYHLLTKGPVSIAFQVASDFKQYKSGIYNSSVCKSGPKDVNHAVLVVGYGEEHHVPYWIVKNSWGADWGEEGYFRILRGKNMCGLATCASYPII